MQEQGGYLPSPDRTRPRMQLELQEDRKLDVQAFMEESELEDRDKDLYSANFWFRSWFIFMMTPLFKPLNFLGYRHQLITTLVF